MTNSVAVIIGGASCWEEDFHQVKKLVGSMSRRYFVINDHIKTWPGPCTAVTVHPPKLYGHFAWLSQRRLNKLPEPDQVWGFQPHQYVTHSTNHNWEGGSGLLAVQVAILEGHKKIIGCGLPMTIEGMHYIRKLPFQDAMKLRPGWERHKDDISPYFRSMSGWTAELFGQPDEAWIYN